jgi:hypothetical protein
MSISSATSLGGDSPSHAVSLSGASKPITLTGASSVVDVGGASQAVALAGPSHAVALTISGKVIVGNVSQVVSVLRDQGASSPISLSGTVADVVSALVQVVPNFGSDSAMISITGRTRGN